MKVLVKVKIIKRAEREKMLAANSAASISVTETDSGKTMTATVKSWVDDLRRKSEDDAALFRKLFKAENCS